MMHNDVSMNTFLLKAELKKYVHVYFYFNKTMMIQLFVCPPPHHIFIYYNHNLEK